ncbi:hypothetical protein Cme02nite_33550 [Catellatospora methionotrophica]|uniref:Uncharacterized protein n=1 Tax=Catellatospora methionotrophica TaxID=121620 RepID=A0A8J3L5U7_9ACTN|nr:hypothetical protein [Catellatospora methionotrophica]GIG15023.1 hypothetical protein Cme02nite_33550 [Catellatospora methionotrophica]
MSDPAAAVVATRYARGTAVAACLVAGGWHVGNDLTALLTNWHAYRPGGNVVGTVVWAAYALVGVVAALRMAGRDVPAWSTAAGLGLLLVGTPAVTAMSPPDLAFSFGNWSWGTVGWFAQLLLWRRPLGHLLALLAVNGVLMILTVAATAGVQQLDVARWGMILYGTAALQVVLAFGARRLEFEATRAAAAAAERHRIAAHEAAGQLVHHSRQSRYQTSARTASELLAAVAAGSADPADPAVRRRAAIEAARLRRLLAEHDDVPQPLLHELRASADIAERRGVSIDLDAVGTVPPLPAQIRRALVDGPLHVIAAARTAARISVAAGHGRVSVGVVADADADPGVLTRAGQAVTVDCHREGDLTCLRSTWHAASTSH